MFLWNLEKGGMSGAPVDFLDWQFSSSSLLHVDGKPKRTSRSGRLKSLNYFYHVEIEILRFLENFFYRNAVQTSLVAAIFDSHKDRSAVTVPEQFKNLYK